MCHTRAQMQDNASLLADLSTATQLILSKSNLTSESATWQLVKSLITLQNRLSHEMLNHMDEE